MHLSKIIIGLAFLGLSATALAYEEGGEVAAVKKAVIGPQEAAWGRHDFQAYMAQWADDARIVTGRGPAPEKYDTVFDRKQIEATRRLLMQAKPVPGQKLVFEDVTVKVEGDRAELRARHTFFLGDDYQVADEIYKLRKTARGWKVSMNRGWVVKRSFNNEITTFDAAHWKRLDEQADALKQTDERGDQAAQALLMAFRFGEAHALFKKVTDRKDAGATDWLQRGQAAMAAGDTDDALAAFRQALRLDAKAPVPPYAREMR